MAVGSRVPAHASHADLAGGALAVDAAVASATGAAALERCAVGAHLGRARACAVAERRHGCHVIGAGCFAAADASARVLAGEASGAVAGASALAAVAVAGRAAAHWISSDGATQALFAGHVAGLALLGAGAVATHAVDAVTGGALVPCGTRGAASQLVDAHPGRAVLAALTLDVAGAGTEAARGAAQERIALLGLNCGARASPATEGLQRGFVAGATTPSSALCRGAWVAAGAS